MHNQNVWIGVGVMVVMMGAMMIYMHHHSDNMMGSNLRGTNGSYSAMRPFSISGTTSNSESEGSGAKGALSFPLSRLRLSEQSKTLEPLSASAPLTESKLSTTTEQHPSRIAVEGNQ